MTMFTATLPGRELAQKFQSIGDMRGRTLSQISAIVGPPNARAFMANNLMLYQWYATGYHIAILFDANNRFVRISSENANIKEPDSSDIAAGIGVVIGLVILVLFVVTHC
jgi:hypothetical protein